MVDFSVPTVGDIPLLLTLLLLELVLSFDNAAILAALANRLPKEQRRKALLYGLVGAYFFRVLAIVFVVVILQNKWLKLIGAGYLLFLMLKHLYERMVHKHEDGTPLRKAPKIWFLSPLWSTIVFIELADIAFALDQIVVAVGLAGDNATIIVIAAFVAIIFLRISAYYIARIMEWFPALETLAYLAVGFVGIKMFIGFEYPFLGWEGYHLPTALSVGVTFSLIALPPLGKLALQLIEGKRVRLPEHGKRIDQVEELEQMEKGVEPKE